MNPIHGDTSALAVDFENHTPGPYTEGHIRADWRNIGWIGVPRAPQIVEDADPKRGKVLEFLYPKGAVGPSQGGGQWLVRLPKSKALWLSYWVRFSDDFDFRKGGKLPGLTSGGSTYTGGVRPRGGEGWSARYMWKEDGRAIVYLYHKKMRGKWGDGLPLSDGPIFKRGQWHQIVEHINVRPGSSKYGLLQVWVDGQLRLTRNDIQFVFGRNGTIDSFYFSTFHGGNQPDWAPLHDCTIRFDDFKIATTRPKEL